MAKLYFVKNDPYYYEEFNDAVFWLMCKLVSAGVLTPVEAKSYEGDSDLIIYEGDPKDIDNILMCMDIESLSKDSATFE